VSLSASIILLRVYDSEAELYPLVAVSSGPTRPAFFKRCDVGKRNSSIMCLYATSEEVSPLIINDKIKIDNALTFDVCTLVASTLRKCRCFQHH